MTLGEIPRKFPVFGEKIKFKPHRRSKKRHPEIMPKARPAEDGISIAIDYYGGDLDRKCSVGREMCKQLKKSMWGDESLYSAEGPGASNHFSLVIFAHLS